MSKKDKQNQTPAQEELLEEQGAQPAPEEAPEVEPEAKMCIRDRGGSFTAHIQPVGQPGMTGLPCRVTAEVEA